MNINAPLKKIVAIISRPERWRDWDIYAEEVEVIEQLHKGSSLVYIRYPTSFLCMAHRAVRICNNAYAAIFSTVRDPPVSEQGRHVLSANMSYGGLLAVEEAKNRVRVVYLIEVGKLPKHLPESQRAGFLMGLGRARFSCLAELNRVVGSADVITVDALGRPQRERVHVPPTESSTEHPSRRLSSSIGSRPSSHASTPRGSPRGSVHNRASHSPQIRPLRRIRSNTWSA
jgi:hypothetical protein